MSEITSLRLENVGQIVKADVALGDLTVLVGPQATGKSIFLQFLRLVLDTGYIHDQLRKYGIDWKKNINEFLDVYLGEGMRGVWRVDKSSSKIFLNEQNMKMTELAIPRSRTKKQSMFYIPAQRVLSLANGWPRPFQGFASDDPFMVRNFSETFRNLMDQELNRRENVFPKTKRLKSEYRKLLSRHIFSGFELHIDRRTAQKRLVLKQEKSDVSIPFMAWSAGQREFVPLLMGLYWLMPGSSTKQRGDLKWIVIEELEMGLHPNGISVVLLLVLDLLWRGYRVCISTHSPHVLDVVWAIRTIQQYRANSANLLDVFEINKKTNPMKAVADSVIQKSVKVFYFDRNGVTKDISNLDPGSNDEMEAGWGGLSEFSGRVAGVVSAVVNSSGKF
jgi:predicted ATP-binding protein involved in virulence